MNHQYRLKVEDTALLVVDMQEKLLPKIMQAGEVLRNASFLVNAAKVLGVPVLATEQFPNCMKKASDLGPLLPVLENDKTRYWDKEESKKYAEIIVKNFI